jgi:hypothetical protein
VVVRFDAVVVASEVIPVTVRFVEVALVVVLFVAVLFAWVSDPVRVRFVTARLVAVADVRTAFVAWRFVVVTPARLGRFVRVPRVVVAFKCASAEVVEKK